MFKLHHVGVIVEDIQKAVETYCFILGLSPSDKRIKRFQGKENHTALVPVGDKELELMQPSEPGSWFWDYAKEQGEGFFHLNIFSDNFDEEVRLLKEKNIDLLEQAHTQIFPGYTLQEAYLRPEVTRGLWIDIINAKKAPPYIGGLAEPLPGEPPPGPWADSAEPADTGQKTMTLHHVGVLVDDLAKTAELYGDMMPLKHKEMITDGDTKIILQGEESSDLIMVLMAHRELVDRFGPLVWENTAGLFHLSLHTSNYTDKIQALKENGITVNEEASPSLPGRFSNRVAWLGPGETHGIWIELVEV